MERFWEAAASVTYPFLVMFPVEPVPEKIGAYQVAKYVGRSGSSDVYIARAEGPLGFSRIVTLKIVRFALEDDARLAEELAREAAICARLNHPVVVRMFDFFEYERRLVLVLEQVDGAGLDRLLNHLARRKQRLGDSAIFYLGSQLASALAHAHASTDEDGNASPVIHRDIKPENVLVGWDGQARLAGFGLGKILGRSPDSIAGTIKGTPGFMSPEQTRGERATVRSDVYGFGVLMWSLLSGLEPPTDGSRLQPLGELRPDLPREVLAAVDAALEPSADRRRISCAEIAQWLAKLVKPEAGREELRQKVLWLRATRGPASRIDPSPAKQPPARRRQAIQAMRQSSRRDSAGPPSSRRPAPSSRRPLSEITRTMEMEAVSGVPRPSTRPTARPPSEAPPGVSIPRPPGLPSDPTIVIPPSTTQPSSARPASGTPPAVRPPTVRTVTQAPPGRTIPPSAPRVVVSADDLVGVPASRPPADPWLDGGGGVASFEAVFDKPPERPNFGPVPEELAKLLAARQPNTFPLVNQLLVAGLTAALVVALGVIFLIRSDEKQPVAAAPPAPPPPAETAAPAAQPPPQPQPAPPPPAPAQQATPANTPQMPDPSELSDQLGYLMVKGPIEAQVYLNGMRKGPTNDPLLVPCGRFFMRLALPVERGFPTWMSRGETVFVACKSSTVLTAKLITDEAGPPPRKRNGFL